MKPTISNAFIRRATGRNAASGRGQPAIATLTASIRETEYGWSLGMSPMRAIDTLPIWFATGNRATAATLVFGLEQSDWRERRQALPVAAIASRIGVPLIDAFDSGCIVVADGELPQLLGFIETTQLSAVRIEGPVEAGDAAAIRAAVRAGRSPLLAELRAVAAMGILQDRHVTLHTRSLAPATSLVAENLRQYLAAILSRNAEQFAAPPAWQIERLLSVSGVMHVRPIETTLNGTSVDVGIGTSADKEPTPATRSLMYDLPSGTWHDEA